MAFGHQQSKPDHLMQSMGVAQKPSQPKPPSSLRDKLSASPSPSARQPQAPGHASSPPSNGAGAGGGGGAGDLAALLGQQTDQASQPDQSGQQPGQGGLGGGEGQKASREDAGFVPAGQICGGCSMFTKETGDCQAVEGIMQPHDSCQKYYQASNPQGQQEGGLEDALESKADSGLGSSGGGSPAIGIAIGRPTSPTSRIGTMNG